jgi:lipoprotein-anchoring transpeptidase ErfK/SrfK
MTAVLQNSFHSETICGSKMIDRRAFVLSVAAFLAMPEAAHAHGLKEPVPLDPRFVPQLVDISFEHEVGTLVVDPKNRFLYLVEKPGTARRYGVGVGRSGLSFTGTAIVGRKAKWPSWRPTKNMIRRDPQKYAKYADGVPGGPTNPLGSRALYLYRDGRDTLYRIHGTTEPSSIGKAVSNGCIRMLNEHVEDLFERVTVGTKVVVLE